VAPREHFIAMLNHNLKLTAIQSSLCHRQLFRYPQSAASGVHGAGEKKRFQSNVKIKDADRINGELKLGQPSSSTTPTFAVPSLAGVLDVVNGGLRL